MTDDMDKEWCTKHSCAAVPITNDAGSAIVGIDCPRCVDEREADRLAFLKANPRQFNQFS